MKTRRFPLRPYEMSATARSGHCDVRTRMSPLGRLSRFDQGSANGRNRRNLVVRAGLGEGRVSTLSGPTARLRSARSIRNSSAPIRPPQGDLFEAPAAALTGAAGAHSEPHVGSGENATFRLTRENCNKRSSPPDPPGNVPPVGRPRAIRRAMSYRGRPRHAAAKKTPRTSCGAV